MDGGIVSFVYENNEVINDTVLISLRTRRVIKSKVRVNRNGRGGKSFRLFDAKYLLYNVYKKDLGVKYYVAVIKLRNLPAGYQIMFLRQWRNLSKVPRELKEILDANRDQLPFYPSQ